MSVGNSRGLKGVEVLIEDTLAASATEDIVTKGGFPGLLGSCERSAAGTFHRLSSVR